MLDPALPAARKLAWFVEDPNCLLTITVLTDFLYKPPFSSNANNIYAIYHNLGHRSKDPLGTIDLPRLLGHRQPRHPEANSHATDFSELQQKSMK